MSQIQSWIIGFICLLALTAYCSWIGDDDIVYQCFDRKATPREGLIRIRWVILKTLTSVQGGTLLAVATVMVARTMSQAKPSQDEFVLLFVACTAVVSLLVGVHENEIRRLSGRQRRPLIDLAIWRKNLGQWLGKS
jgi:hypothetical protein